MHAPGPAGRSSSRSRAGRWPRSVSHLPRVARAALAARSPATPWPHSLAGCRVRRSSSSPPTPTWPGRSPPAGRVVADPGAGLDAAVAAGVDAARAWAPARWPSCSATTRRCGPRRCGPRWPRPVRTRLRGARCRRRGNRAADPAARPARCARPSAPAAPPRRGGSASRARPRPTRAARRRRRRRLARPPRCGLGLGPRSARHSRSLAFRACRLPSTASTTAPARPCSTTASR